MTFLKKLFIGISQLQVSTAFLNSIKLTRRNAHRYRMSHPNTSLDFKAYIFGPQANVAYTQFTIEGGLQGNTLRFTIFHVHARFFFGEGRIG